MNFNLTGSNSGDLTGIFDLGLWIFGLLCAVGTVLTAVILSVGRRNTWALPSGRSRAEFGEFRERGTRQNQAFEMFGRLSRPRREDPPTF